jgi:hypothetical protein
MHGDDVNIFQYESIKDYRIVRLERMRIVS